jgi:hypothetical protein
LYKENSRGLSAVGEESIVDGADFSLAELVFKDGVLEGGSGIGAVVTDPARDRAIDIVVFEVSVIVAQLSEICDTMVAFDLRAAAACRAPGLAKRKIDVAKARKV